MRRSNLRTNDPGRFPHLFPDPNRRRIHIKQSYLLAALSPETIDADSRQESPLPGPGQVRPHADGRSIFDVLYVFHALRDNLIVRHWQCIFRDAPFEKIVRRETGVILWNAHSAPCREIQ